MQEEDRPRRWENKRYRRKRSFEKRSHYE